MSTLVALPLKKEMQFLLEELESLGHSNEIKNLPHLGMRWLPTLNIFVAAAGHGKTQFAIQTQYILQNQKGIKQILGIGSAGALTEETAVGDVVISRQTVEHDYTEKFSPAPSPRFAGDQKLVEIAGRIRPKGFRVHIGNIASGDEDVIDQLRAEELYQLTQGLAVAWEGAGLARAAQFMKTPHLEVRAITDFANKNTPVDFQANLKLAMKNSAAFLIHFLDELNAPVND